AQLALDAQQTAALLAPYAGRLAIAALNSPRSTVVAGEVAALEALLVELERRQIAVRRLKVPYAFHSPQMAAWPGELEALLAGLEPRAGELRLVSTVSGRAVAGSELD